MIQASVGDPAQQHRLQPGNLEKNAPVAVNFVSSDGQETVVSATDADTVMEAARDNGVAGIIGECGGILVCATCHVYVGDEWVDRLAPCTPDEDGMLECTAAERRPNSRLSCQIKLNRMLDGLAVEIPAEQ